jgi:hypothetical protein
MQPSSLVQGNHPWATARQSYTQLRCLLYILAWAAGLVAVIADLGQGCGGGRGSLPVVLASCWHNERVAANFCLFWSANSCLPSNSSPACLISNYSLGNSTNNPSMTSILSQMILPCLPCHFGSCALSICHPTLASDIGHFSFFSLQNWPITSFHLVLIMCT